MTKQAKGPQIVLVQACGLDFGNGVQLGIHALNLADCVDVASIARANMRNVPPAAVRNTASMKKLVRAGRRESFNATLG